MGLTEPDRLEVRDGLINAVGEGVAAGELVDVVENDSGWLWVEVVEGLTVADGEADRLREIDWLAESEDDDVAACDAEIVSDADSVTLALGLCDVEGAWVIVGP